MTVAVPAWGDPADGTNPPPLAGDARADVCVVGLGGSGLAAVHALLDAGARVVGIDAGPIAGGAAGRNGGFLLGGTPRFHHDAVATWGRERAAGLYRETLAEIDRLTAELGPAIVRRVGSLRLPADAAEAEDCARQLAALRADGLAAHAAGDVAARLSPAERAAASRLAGGILVQDDGAIDPLARCRLLAARALERGARLHAGTVATGIRGDRVTTHGGEVACQAVIVAVDGGLERVLPELAGRVRSTRLQMLGTSPLSPRWPRPVYHRWGYDYWQQLADGRILLGGGRDRCEADEWGAAAEPSEPVQRQLDGLLAALVGPGDGGGGRGLVVTHRWAGVVAYADDGLPVLEAVRPGVLAVGGHSGHGNVLGSAAGRAAAAIALQQAPPRLAGLLSPQAWGST